METRVITETKISGSIEHQGELRFEPEGEAGWIIVEGAIVADRVFIKAGWSIKAGEFIEAGRSIKAGGFIKAGWSILSLTFEIRCTLLLSRLLPFWREFYAAMPPLAKWASEITDDCRCWESLRGLATKEEAEAVCAWEGWHWIIRAQLEMFFGLKTEVAPPEPWLVVKATEAPAVAAE